MRIPISLRISIPLTRGTPLLISILIPIPK
ncbi:unnamed protein product, partial [Adineta steineri]